LEFAPTGTASKVRIEVRSFRFAVECKPTEQSTQQVRREVRTKLVRIQVRNAELTVEVNTLMREDAPLPFMPQATGCHTHKFSELTR
jgi:hypothetical protein